MIISIERNFAFLAMTKAASTSIETVLSPHADVIFQQDSRFKHMSARKFRRFMQPYLRNMGHDSIETHCVFRDPIDWLHSWYCYRARPGIIGKPESTAKVTFEKFVIDYLAKPEQSKGIGRPARFVTDRNGELIVDHIFLYDDLPKFIDFLENRFDTKLELPKLNVSTPRHRDLSTSIRKQAVTYFAPEYEIIAQAKS